MAAPTELIPALPKPWRIRWNGTIATMYAANGALVKWAEVENECNALLPPAAASMFGSTANLSAEDIDALMKSRPGAIVIEPAAETDERDARRYRSALEEIMKLHPNILANGDKWTAADCLRVAQEKSQAALSTASAGEGEK